MRRHSLLGINIPKTPDNIGIIYVFLVIVLAGFGKLDPIVEIL